MVDVFHPTQPADGQAVRRAAPLSVGPRHERPVSHCSVTGAETRVLRHPDRPVDHALLSLRRRRLRPTADYRLACFEPAAGMQGALKLTPLSYEI